MNRSKYLTLIVCFSLLLSIAQGYRIIGPWVPIFKGAEIAYCSTDNPCLQKLTAIRIDLQDPDLSFYHTPSNGGDPYETTRQTGSAFMTSSACDIGINAHYYLSYGDYSDLQGLGMSNGNVVSPPTDEWPNGGTLLITYDNIATIAKTYAYTDTSPYWTAVESRQWFILKQGSIYSYGDISIHPRSAVGITQDGRYLIFMTIDGRQTGYSEGASIPETAQWLIDLGAYDGLNLDGGGSTHMLISDPSGPITVNSPSEDRAVGSHVGAYLAPAPVVPSYQTDAPITNGLIVHLRADLLGLAEGESVEIWQDIATNDSVDGTLYTVGKHGFPTYRATGYNGTPAVEFNGTQALASSDFSWNETQGVCVFIVCTGGNGDVQRVLQIGNGGIASQNIGCDVSLSSSGFRYNNGYAVVSGVISAGTWHTSIRQVAQGAAHNQGFYAVDDTTAETLTCNYPARIITFVPDNNYMTLGCGSSTVSTVGTDRYTGMVSQVLIYNRQLSTQEMQTILDYLQGGGAPDTTPPTPDPMTWASAPAAISSSEITMTATTASDPSGVEYYFDETSGNAGGTDSGWQDSPSYTDSGLTAGTTYSYTVKARDKSINLNETAVSAVAYATTSSGNPEMYVYSITMASKKAGPNYCGLATVLIKDTTGANVSGATVYGTWSGAVSQSVSGTTQTDGTVLFESAKVKNGGTFTFTVTDVVKSGIVYNPSLNMETSDSITAP